MRPAGGRIRAELARDAVANLRAQGRRSMLALLGVMIGSASIVALLGFIHIGRAEVMTRFRDVGVDTVQVAADPAGGRWFDPVTVGHLFETETRTVQVASVAVDRGTVRIGRHALSGAATAVSAAGAQMMRLDRASGRGLSAADGCNGAAVLGARLARESGARIGQTAFFQNYGFHIVGILPASTPQAIYPVEPDDALFIGMECARRVMPHDGVSHYLVRLHPDTNSEAWAADLRRHLTRLGAVSQIKTPQELIAAMDAQMNLMAAILVAIGSVSLLVGGVGVMNVMLMSVMERHREIGLRAAIGATPSEIVFIFVVEAVALSVGGGLLGALAGVGLTALGCVFLPFSFSFDPMVLVWGTGVAGVVGLVFGIHPAVAASRILPVEALRAD